MAFHISRPSMVDSDITVYYAGNRNWTDDFSKRERFDTAQEANDLMVNPDGKNGGWERTTVAES